MKEQKTFNTPREAIKYLDSLSLALSPEIVNNVVITMKNLIQEFSQRSIPGGRNFYNIEAQKGLWHYNEPITNFQMEIRDRLGSLWDDPSQIYTIEFNVPSPFLDFHELEDFTKI